MCCLTLLSRGFSVNKQRFWFSPWNKLIKGHCHSCYYRSRKTVLGESSFLHVDPDLYVISLMATGKTSNLVMKN
jgi:hypothetical protein